MCHGNDQSLPHLHRYFRCLTDLTWFRRVTFKVVQMMTSAEIPHVSDSGSLTEIKFTSSCGAWGQRQEVGASV
jgi:hypothetical protein